MCVRALSPVPLVPRTSEIVCVCTKACMQVCVCALWMCVCVLWRAYLYVCVFYRYVCEYF